MKSLAFSLKNQVHTSVAFHGLPDLQLVDSLVSVKNDAEEMLTVLFDFFSHGTFRLADFEFLKNTYSRTILHREESGFEIMVAHWDRGARTPIHGHPAFSLFYVIKGKIKETLFTRNHHRIDEELTTIHTPGDYTYHQGIAGRFDNAIHKLSALEESLSFHIYSDDALKGEVF